MTMRTPGIRPGGFPTERKQEWLKLQVTPEQIAALAESFIKSLDGVRTASGDEAAARACELLTRLSLFHVFTRLGPQAAKAMMVRVFADLQSEISTLNGGSTTLS